MTRKDKINVLMVGDGQVMLNLFHEVSHKLSPNLIDIVMAKDGNEGFKIYSQQNFNIVMIDFDRPNSNGFEFIKKIRQSDIYTYILMSTFQSHPDVIKKFEIIGVNEVLLKPVKPTLLTTLIKKYSKICETKLARTEKGNYGMVGNSEEMIYLYKMMDILAQTNSPVLISGETGTGKELIASCIHKKSLRSEKPFVVIDCGSIPETLLESELFGHRKGAFTGANHDKKGFFKVAHRGTVFLDEIDKLSYHSQSKLLRILQEHKFRPIGGTDYLRVDIRIISATNKDLKIEIENGHFREDLYYRLNVIPVFVPPLRKRKEDIPLLVNHFIDKHRNKLGKPIRRFSKELLDVLMKLNYPGNVRELENIIHLIVLFSERENVSLSDVPAKLLKISKESNGSSSQPVLVATPSNTVIKQLIENVDWETIGLKKIIDIIFTKMIEEALLKTKWNKTQASNLLKISLASLKHYMKKYNL